MILCAAGDPGGSRAVLAVAETLLRRGETVRIPRHGTLAKEVPALMAGCLCDENEAFDFLPRCKALVFGSSTHDAWPLALARAAKAKGAVVMHVLDNWSTYMKRLCTDGLPPLVPDIYTVIDEESRKGAEAEGVPAAALVVAGHPGLADTADALERLAAQRRTGCAGPLAVAFVCEPFAAVFGRDCRVQGHPGFTEETVLESFAAALATVAPDVHVYLLPHPKQRPEDISRLWDKVRGPLEGKVLSLPRGRDVLSMVSGVAGMASILLYEAWLGGFPVLSMQPDCRLPALRRFASLKDIAYTDKETAVPAATAEWLAQCRRTAPVPRHELFFHKAAPRKIVEMLLNHIRNIA